MLLWIEGFEGFGTTNGNQLSGFDIKYPGSTIALGTRVRDGRLVGKSLSHESTLELTFTTPNLGNMATVVVGFAFSTATVTAHRLAGLLEDDAAVDGINVRLAATGALEIRRANTLIATSGTTPITANTWYYIEMKVEVAESGSYEVRVNGANVLSGSGDTRAGSTNNYANRVRFGNLVAGYGSSIAKQYDDMYILDTTGSTNNDFLGDQTVLTIFPNAAGDSTDLTPNTGDNYDAVNENPADGDTTYVESSTPGDMDLYNFDGASLENIKGIQINAALKKTDSTDFDINLVAKSGTTTDSGTAQTVDHTSYANKHRVLEENPDTTAAWEDTEVSAAQFGLELDS